jgi:hypothetical protein
LLHVHTADLALESSAESPQGRGFLTQAMLCTGVKHAPRFARKRRRKKTKQETTKTQQGRILHRHDNGIVLLSFTQGRFRTRGLGHGVRKKLSMEIIDPVAKTGPERH